MLFKSQLTPEDIKYKEAAGKLSRTERQWLQIEKERDDDFTEFVDIEGLKARNGHLGISTSFYRF